MQSTCVEASAFIVFLFIWVSVSGVCVLLKMKVEEDLFYPPDLFIFILNYAR